MVTWSALDEASADSIRSLRTRSPPNVAARTNGIIRASATLRRSGHPDTPKRVFAPGLARPCRAGLFGIVPQLVREVIGPFGDLESLPAVQDISLAGRCIAC